MRKLLNHFDTRVSAGIALWPRMLQTPMILASFVGLPIITMAIAGLLLIIGLLSDQPSLSTAALVALLVYIFSTLLKLSFQRPRPVTDYVEQMLIHSYSFPSGHSVGSTVSYGLVAYIALQTGAQPTATIIAVSLGLLIIAIGLSRIYLGAHFASDVLGGWLVGVAGLVIIIEVIKPLSQ